MNQTFTIDKQAEEKLGKYVYALIDPRDDKVFYIGQGENTRINGHFTETRMAIERQKHSGSKTRRIHDIWQSGESVHVHIIRWGLETKAEADHVEGACIAVLGLSQNGATYNKNAGPRSVGHGKMSLSEVAMLNAEPVNPRGSLSLLGGFLPRSRCLCPN